MGQLGGFIEAQGTQPRPKWTRAQILAAVPATRGPFVFPAPYNTQAYRLTDGSECGATTDCVWYVGYSYWRNMNYHVNDSVIKIFLGNNSGTGPQLYTIHKTSNAVARVGPIFPVGSVWRNWNGEGWYWNHQNQDWLYISDRLFVYRYNVVNGTQQLMINAKTMWGANREVFQMHSAFNDNEHVFTVRTANSAHTVIGAGYYRESPSLIRLYSAPNMNECMIDQSGRWTLILENDLRMRVFDNTTGTQVLNVPPNTAGGFGHADAGWGFFVGYDYANALPTQCTSVRTMNPQQYITPPIHTNYSPSSCVKCYASLNHLSMPRSSAADYANQVVIGSNVDTNAEQNEITAVRMDDRHIQLIVAPVMTDLVATGGGTTYAKFPKGNCDVTGEYFIWTTNLGSNRLDAFVVKVPKDLLFDVAPAAPTGVMVR